MRTIGQRELRNDSGEIMRQVQRGAVFQVTSRGNPVAVLAPVGHNPVDELTLREGSQHMVFPDGVAVAESTSAVLTQMRGDR